MTFAHINISEYKLSLFLIWLSRLRHHYPVTHTYYHIIIYITWHIKILGLGSGKTGGMNFITDCCLAWSVNARTPWIKMNSTMCRYMQWDMGNTLSLVHPLQVGTIQFTFFLFENQHMGCNMQNKYWLLIFQVTVKIIAPRLSRGRPFYAQFQNHLGQ